MHSLLWFESGSTNPAGQQNALQGKLKEKFPCQNPSMSQMEGMWISAESGLEWGESVHLAPHLVSWMNFYVLMDKTWPCTAFRDGATT